jgi:hypothetical protein
MLKRGVGDDRDEVRPFDVVKIIEKKHYVILGVL